MKNQLRKLSSEALRTNFLYSFVVEKHWKLNSNCNLSEIGKGQKKPEEKLQSQKKERKTENKLFIETISLNVT